jgi:hypothetical protein
MPVYLDAFVLTLLFDQQLQQSLRYRRHYSGHIVEGRETLFRQSNERLTSRYALEKPEARMVEFSGISVYHEFVKHEAFRFVVHNHIGHYDSCAAVSEVGLAQAQRVEHLSLGRAEEGDQSVIPQMAGMVDVTRLKPDPALERVFRKLVQFYARHIRCSSRQFCPTKDFSSSFNTPETRLSNPMFQFH